MLNATRSVKAAHPVWIALTVGLAGCGQVLGIDDWQQAGTGGAGGDSANAATGSSGAQTSTASGMPGSEVCTNGTDDDADGAVDCADSDCAGYTCAPALPPTWMGPVAVFVGMPGATLPSCGPDWTNETDFFTGTLTAPDAQCSACDCGAPMGTQCTLSPVSHFTFYKDLMCTMVGSSMALSANQCMQVTSDSGYSVAAYKVNAEAIATGGSCAAVGGTASVQPASFDKIARVCSGLTGGAGCADATCVPPPPPSFRPSLCIYREVFDDPSLTCPAGYSPLPKFYKGIADTRACTPCSCAAPAGATCEPVVQVFDPNSMCTGGVVQTLDYCNALASPTFSATMRLQAVTGTPANGGCSPAGPSLPAGEAYGTNSTLVCCLP